MERDLSTPEFSRFQALIYELAGIHYPDEKLALLSNRIRRRLRATGLTTYDAYLGSLGSGKAAECSSFLDAVTTNETYFFRCQRHWDHFRQWAQQRASDPATRRDGFRIWSAAASSGAEAFTAVIVLHQILGPDFGGVPVEVLGTDLSTQVLEEAQKGIYRPYALAQTDPAIVRQYFRRAGPDELVFDPQLAKVVRFERHNLMDPLPRRVAFDFVFLRNVMIYFDARSKARVLQNAFAATRPGGILLVGEAESLINVDQPFQYVKPSVFCKPAKVEAKA
ncbi:MAG: protein-glutamate O-methyltransferase CheR [Planctomycetota bacterium]|nr:protein-glutamate O-methyltransferase CheR [Planctomycetota bacterium]